MIAIRNQDSSDDVYAELAELNPDAMIADGFESAYIGYTTGVMGTVAVYDCDLCVESLVKDEGMSREEAVEYLEFNTFSAYVGEGTPLFVVRRKND